MWRIATAVIPVLVALACSSPAQDLPTTTQLLGSGGRIAEVVRVVDGDTIDVVFPDGETDRVRLLGVDTPEAQGQNQAHEYGTITDTACLDDWGREATDFATSLEGREVTLVSDPQAGDRGFFDRLLAYVHVDGQDIGAELVRMGLARVYTEGDSNREREYLELQDLALEDNIGLWRCRAPAGVGGDPPVGATEPVVDGVRYDPLRADRDCGDFTVWIEAQALYNAVGGPERPARPGWG